MLKVSLSKNIGPLSIKAHFSVGPNRILALCGSSGTGKTTVINMLAGLEQPVAGKIKLGNRWVYNKQLGINLPPRKRRFGYVFQEGRLFPHLNVRSNLVYGMKLVPESERRIYFEQTVGLLGLGKLLKRRPSRLSGGEKQRVAIGRSLLMNPSLLLMDEPLSSLDEKSKNEIIPYISTIARDIGIPVVYVSHSVEEIRCLADETIHVEVRSSESRFVMGSPNKFPVVEQSHRLKILQSA